MTSEEVRVMIIRGYESLSLGDKSIKDRISDLSNGTVRPLSPEESELVRRMSDPKEIERLDLEYPYSKPHNEHDVFLYYSDHDAYVKIETEKKNAYDVEQKRIEEATAFMRDPEWQEAMREYYFGNHWFEF